MRVNAIVIPLIRSELCDLKTWLRYCPKSGKSSKKVYLSIDQTWHEADKKDILDTYSRCSLHEEGWTLEFVECQMTAEESFYLKRSKVSIDIVKHPYGQKSGPNMQFFRTIRVLKQSRVEINAVLLMEVDAFPVASGWLTVLNDSLKDIPSNLLISGPRYAGRSFLKDEIKDHFNGNSVYFIGCGDFYRFLDCWEELLLQSMKIEPFMAYDVVIPWYMNHRITHKGVFVLTSENTEFAAECYRSRSFDLTQFLINYGGPDENHNDYKLDVPAFLQEFPSALIVHGKCFMEDIHTLRLSQKFTARRHPANILVDAIMAGDYEGSLLLGINNYALMKIITKKVERLTSRQALLIQREWTNE